MPAWNLPEERQKLELFETKLSQVRERGNEELASLLEDLVRATKRRILALEKLESLGMNGADDPSTK
jgi:hypothetical protein